MEAEIIENGSLKDYVIKKLDSDFFNNIVDDKKVKLHVYALPNLKNVKFEKDDKKLKLLKNKVKKDFNILRAMSKKVLCDKETIFECATAKKILIHVKEYYKGYLYAYVFFVFMYSAYLYLGLREIGIPLDMMKETSSFIIIFIFIILVLIIISLGIVPFVIYNLYDYSDKPPSWLLILLLIGIIYIVVKKRERLKEKITFNINIIWVSIIKPIFVSIIGLELLLLFLAPFVYYVYKLTLWHFLDIYGQPTFLIKLYKGFSGYPKIFVDDNKTKYIVIGENNKYFQVYDLNMTTQYIHKKTDNKEFCEKIRGEDTVGMAISILLQSRYNEPDENLEYIKRNQNYTTAGLSLESMDINATKLKKDCNDTLNNN